MTVLTINGGGHWADKFVDAASQVIVQFGYEASSIEEIWPILRQVDFFSVHYTPVVAWAMRELPAGSRLYAHFHTAPNSDNDVQVITRAVGRCQRVAFPTASSREEYGALIEADQQSLFLDKTGVLPNIADPQFMLARISARKRQDLSVAVVARLDRDKTSPDLLLETIFRVCTILPQVRFLIAGYGEDLLFIRKEITAARLDGRVQTLGFVENVQDIYGSADVVFLPSVSEVMPYAALEALQFGVPCVIPDVVDVGPLGSEMIELCRANSPESCAKSIVRLLKSIRSEGPQSHGAVARTGEWTSLVMDWFSEPFAVDGAELFQRGH
ncbi:glycosyltransferase family 4 protein [Streptomyces sp. NPDC058954]|uniref:glycosyltransferase family 4 protein n=1 Tax=Streptomyces sp. NPDC058954 TaxID=3346677 RepID=UPI00369C98B6